MPTSNRKEQTEIKLRNALIELLKQKTFDKITTTELVSLAKISRSGFYTHYTDIYDMIDSYQKTLFSTIQYVFEKNNADLRSTLLEVLEFLDRNEIYAALLSENASKEIHQFLRQKLKELLEKTFYDEMDQNRQQQLGKLGKVYATSYYAHAIFGLIQTWILRKRKESPAQIADLLVALIGR